MNNNNYKFTLLRPGGNDTCLIHEIVPSSQKRKQINDLIQNKYPNIEQVGFINPNKLTPQLLMSGGEFCANANRAAAWYYLQGQPGEIQLQIPGIRQKIKIGITKNQETYTELPIYKNPNKIIQINRTDTLVEMKGITHIVSSDKTAIIGRTPEEIKQIALKKIEKNGLKKLTASGIMYTSKTTKGIQLIPIVYVRTINTLYYETACGSGSTAVGLALAKQTKKSLSKLKIWQPSEVAIKVSIEYKNNKFTGAQIQGSCEKLKEGILEL